MIRNAILLAALTAALGWMTGCENENKICCMGWTAQHEWVAITAEQGTCPKGFKGFRERACIVGYGYDSPDIMEFDNSMCLDKQGRKTLHCEEAAR